MIRITFNVDNPSITFLAGMHDGAAAYRAITADRGCFLGIAGLEHLGMGFNRVQIKPQTADCQTGSASSRDLDKLPSIYLHGVSFSVAGLRGEEMG
jgi:hypothetical protein